MLMRSSCRPQVTMKLINPENPNIKKTAERLGEYEREISLGGT